MEKTLSALQHCLILFIRGYRCLISPMLANHCRFQPTCSTYAEQAIKEHGCLRGGIYTMTRLLRCHPFAKAGIDPVPERK